MSLSYYSIPNPISLLSFDIQQFRHHFEIFFYLPDKTEDKTRPVKASLAARHQDREFSELKLGYRSDLRFSQVEVFEMTEIMGIAPTEEQDTTFPNLTM